MEDTHLLSTGDTTSPAITFDLSTDTYEIIGNAIYDTKSLVAALAWLRKWMQKQPQRLAGARVNMAVQEVRSDSLQVLNLIVKDLRAWYGDQVDWSLSKNFLDRLESVRDVRVKPLDSEDDVED
jgi:hypothetical protein